MLNIRSERNKDKKVDKVPRHIKPAPIKPVNLTDHNNQILKVLESDISLLHLDIKKIKEDILFIKEYTIRKKKKKMLVGFKIVIKKYYII